MVDGVIAIIAHTWLVQSLRHAFDGISSLIAFPPESVLSADDVNRCLQSTEGLRAVVLETVALTRPAGLHIPAG